MELALLNNALDGILAINFAGDIIYANVSACRLLKISEEEILSKNFLSLCNPEHKAIYEKIREAILFNDPVDTVTIEIPYKNEKSLSLVAQYSPIKDAGNKINGISIILRQPCKYHKINSKSQALIETAPDGMVIVNKEGQILLANAQTEKLFGYKKEELLGKKIEILIPEEYIKRHQKHRKKYVKNPSTRNMGQGGELYGKHKNGSKFQIEISLSPLKTEDGTYVSAAIRDITERKRAERKFKGLLESAPDAMVIVGKDGIIQLVNTQVENIFGYKKKELIGKKVELLMPESFQKDHPSHRDKFFSNPKVRPMGAGLELKGKRKNGEEFPIEISLSPLETEEGILVSAAIRDITKRIEAQKALKAYNSELRNKNKELKQFAYIASHDLQEPLRTVGSIIKLFEEDYSKKLDEQGIQYLAFINEATERMSLLISGLLDYSLIGKNSILQNINTQEIVNNIIRDLSSTIQETNTTFTIDTLPTIKGYETEFRLLLQNLILNAIKFRKKTQFPKIHIFATEDTDYWIFSVQDNGIGIAKEHLEKIFGLFQRIHLKTEYQGTGIGLAHCQKIVDLHEGKIKVESTLGEGSKFICWISKNLK